MTIWQCLLKMLANTANLVKLAVVLYKLLFSYEIKIIYLLATDSELNIATFHITVKQQGIALNNKAFCMNSRQNYA